DLAARQGVAHGMDGPAQHVRVEVGDVHGQAVHVDVDDHDAPVRAGDAHHLAEDDGRVGDMDEEALAAHPVERVGGEVEVHGVTDVERHGQIGALGPLPGDGDHRLAGVDADHRPFGPDDLGQPPGVLARPAAEVEGPVAGAEAEFG